MKNGQAGRHQGCADGGGGIPERSHLKITNATVQVAGSPCRSGSVIPPQTRAFYLLRGDERKQQDFGSLGLAKATTLLPAAHKELIGLACQRLKWYTQMVYAYRACQVAGSSGS